MATRARGVLAAGKGCAGSSSTFVNGKGGRAGGARPRGTGYSRGMDQRRGTVRSAHQSVVEGEGVRVSFRGTVAGG